jgi:GNAT superfamily N-acetyltransferase
MNSKHAHLTYKNDVANVEHDIERRLLQSLGVNQPQAVNRHFNLVTEDESGTMVAGLTAATSYGWLLIKMLWVCESQRNTGVGTELMQRAEQIAIEAGCHGAWLDTSSASAQAFYVKLGYEPFGILENQPGQLPPSHKRWFMKKALPPVAGVVEAVGHSALK